jgi:MFS family permease
MAWYTVLLSILFAAGFGAVGAAVRGLGWRNATVAIAIVLASAVVPLPFMVRRLHAESRRDAVAAGAGLAGAMKSPAFWLFVVAISSFAYVSSGIGLFNESVLAERGFERKTFEMFLVVTTLAALVGQFLCGWFSRWQGSKYLLAEALVLYAAGLASLTVMKTQSQLWIVATLVGVAGGMLTVLFFSVWGEIFGKGELGRIQGVAQMCTVIASAAGPVAFANAYKATGSYQTILWTMAGLSGALALLACVTKLPEKRLA